VLKPNEARRFAVLYVNGPRTVRGKWAVAEARAGVKADPDDPEVRKAIEAEGGSLPPLSNIAPIDAKLPDLPALVAKAETPDDWKRLAKDLEQVASQIAKGEVKATAAQTSMLKHILDRAHGKVAATQESKTMPAGILVLPTLGEGSSTMICPQCLYNATGAKPHGQN